MDTSDDQNILKILLEEDDDVDVLLWSLLSEEKRKDHCLLFTNRSTEGYHETLINGHLKNNEIKFRVSFNQFDLILNLIRDDLTLNPCFGDYKLRDVWL